MVTGHQLVQLLTPEGEVVEHPEFAFDGGPAEIRGFYRDLVLTRRIDTEATALQRQGELGIWASLLGQEAAQIGSGRAMATQDFAFPTYREHGVAWCRGVDPLNLLGLFRGVDQGAWDPREKNFGLYTIVIGAPDAARDGLRMGLQRDGVVGTGDPERDAPVFAYFGDGATSQGDVTRRSSSPASSTPPPSSSARTTSGRSPSRSSAVPHPALPACPGLRLPGIRVDGNDVLGLLRGDQGCAPARARGQRPDVRRGVHLPHGCAHHVRTTRRGTGSTTTWSTGSSRTRSPGWRLISSAAATPTTRSSPSWPTSPIARRDLRAGCLALPEPTILDMFDRVYADTPPDLLAQRDQYATYLSSFEGSH
jgi:pyruvate dehydrogenase E1 component alpha subunit